jgi:hypothetical protein
MAIRWLSRRNFLQMSGVGLGMGCLSGWVKVLGAQPAEIKAPAKSCILLWMDGGPSHYETFDPKPEAKQEYRGAFKPIATAVPGVQFSEHLPKLAKLMGELAVIRSMQTPEADHQRAKYHLKTSYRQRVGGLVYPSIGSIVSAEKGKPGFPLPSYITCGKSRFYASGSGFLGAKHQPLEVQDPGKGIENIKALGDGTNFASKLKLAEDLEQSFHRNYKAPSSEAHIVTRARATQLMTTPEVKAFELDREDKAVKESYGDSNFGMGCLLARRLVEVGVPFIEVDCAGWDTHSKNFELIKDKLAPQLDTGMSALLVDLKKRGLLNQTLVVCMGEFGRTPKINGGDGRDHYPKAWSLALAGAGIQGGRVIGKTDKDGTDVADRRVSVYDLFATICELIGVDYTKEFTPANTSRPIRILDNHGEKPLCKELGVTIPGA